jgi:hypothetical protein
MTDYICEVCNVTFKQKRTYDNHLKTKKHSSRTTNEISDKYRCHCGRKYKFKQGLHTHKKTCTHEPIANVLEDEVATLKTTIEEERRIHNEERDLLREQIALLLEKFGENPSAAGVGPGSNITTNSNNNTSIDTQNNVTININAFGNENLDYLTDKVIVKCIGRIYNSVPILVEHIHFDPNHPENHNVKITNKKLPYASVLTENNKWKTVDKNDVIENIMGKGYDILDTTYDDNKNAIQPHIQKRFKEFQDKYTNQDKQTIKHIKKNIELSLLNKGSSERI